jgi:RNA polymerase sigma-70 factor (ECF subfamily)
MNSAYDYLRGKKKYKDLVEKQKSLPVDTGLDPEKKLVNKEIKEKIETCLKTLSPKEKSVFLLRDGEGFSIKETSGILGCSSMSVRTHLSRARQKIRKQFEKIYPFRYGEVKQ